MSNENQNAKTSRDQEAGAFWIKKSKAGNTFLSGYFLDANKEKVSVVVFKNNFKKAGEPSPDYRIYLSDNSKNQQAQVNSTEQASSSEEASSSDDIPF
jgi:uncharacterized protein (DUF736 family)